MSLIVNGIVLPEDDTHFAQGILNSPLFQDKGTYQLKKLTMGLELVPVSRRGVALDVGGHVGLWSRVLSAHFRQVVAFEPVPHLAECFRQNAPGVELHEVALGHGHATAVGFVVEKGNSGNSRFAHREHAPSTVVDMRTLDSYRFPVVDFLKIDVEGFETAVVQGGENTIRMCKPVIVVEQKPGHAPRYGFGETEAVTLLKSWGFTVAWTLAGDFCLVAK